MIRTLRWRSEVPLRRETRPVQGVHHRQANTGPSTVLHGVDSEAQRLDVLERTLLMIR